MSAQSIYVKTVDTVKLQLDADICKQAQTFLYKKRFELGKGVNKRVRNHALIASKFIQTENCDLIRYMNSELKGCEIETDLNSTYTMWQSTATIPTKACFTQTVAKTEEECLDICWTEKEW